MPPNILFIHTDQHRFDCLGANGHSLLQTPHLDRLAAGGINFTHAFTPIAVCIPARNSFLYGQWPTQHLAIANWNTEAPRPAREGMPTVSEALNEAGYHLTHVGKWHIHSERGPGMFGYHENVPESQYTHWRNTAGFPPKPSTHGWMGEPDPHIPPGAARLAWSADQVIHHLETAVQNDRPFFLHWETNEPHLPNVVPEPYASMYHPQDIAPWPGFPDPLAGKPYIQAQQRRTWKVDAWTWENWAPIVARYLGEISLLDAQIGRILDALDRLGIARNTLVVYTPDHGDMCGGHGMVDKHYILYEDVVRVPLLMRWPDRIPSNTTAESFVSNALDLAVTFCKAAGGPVPDPFQGQNLLSIIDGSAPGRNDILAMYHGNQFGLYSQRMVRDRTWKYIWNATAEDELYNLREDPGELQNRATDTTCRSELTRLRRRLVTWMGTISDPLLNHWNRAQLLENLTI